MIAKISTYLEKSSVVAIVRDGLRGEEVKLDHLDSLVQQCCLEVSPRTALSHHDGGSA